MPTTRQKAANGSARRGRWHRLAVGTAMAGLVAVGSVVVPAAAPQAEAAEIPNGITNVFITETTVQNGQSQMQLNVDFAVGAGIGHDPVNGVKGGDTFWLQLDPLLTTRALSYDIYAENSATEIVARMTTTTAGLVTIRLTDFVDERSSTEGTVHWLIRFRNSGIAAGAHDLTFQTASTTFADRVTTRTVYNSGPSDPPGTTTPTTIPAIDGNWNSVNERRGIWVARLANGPADTLVFESFGWSETGGPEWRFDCDRTLGNINQYRRLFAPAVDVSIACNENYLRWEISNVPEYASRGLQPLLQVDFDVIDPSRTGGLTFRFAGTFSVTNDGEQVDTYRTGTLRQTIGATAIGPVTPTVPTVTQSACDNGTPVDPDIALPLNIGGITYYLSDPNYEAGETVTVIAELTPRYSWENGVDPYVVDGTHATYDVVLDPAPDCDLSPQNPTVTQTQCDGPGTATDPLIAFATVAGITYSTDPATYVAGQQVALIATLETGRVWNDPMTAGWTRVSDSEARRTITLNAAPDCRVALTPAQPTITQTGCDVDVPIDPDVQLPPALDGVEYTLSGTVSPGEDVTVVATLDAGYKYPTTLPKGWEQVSSVRAEYDIHLAEAKSCITDVTPIDPTVSQTSCSAGDVVLPVVDPAARDASISYLIEGTVQPGATVTVVATLPGREYAWPPAMPAGWEKLTDSTASFRVTLDPADCGTAAGSDSDGDLANTGANVALLPIGLIATLLLLLGAVLVVLRARRATERR